MEELNEVAARRNVYRFRSSDDLVVALGTTSIESLVAMRDSLDIQASLIATDLAVVNQAIDNISG